MRFASRTVLSGLSFIFLLTVCLTVLGQGGPVRLAQRSEAAAPGRSDREDSYERRWRMLSGAFQEHLECDAAAWEKIEPPLRKVSIYQMKQTMARMRERMSPGRSVPRMQPLPEEKQLQAILSRGVDSPEKLDPAIKALREARAKERKEYETMKEDLRKVLTRRQEATLILMKVLD